jgi:hypothetical protein
VGCGEDLRGKRVGVQGLCCIDIRVRARWWRGWLCFAGSERFLLLLQVALRLSILASLCESAHVFPRGLSAFVLGGCGAK